MSASTEPSPRRLVVLLDGTWNKRESTTSVWRMNMMLRQTPNQLVYYDEGVGTAKGESFRGGTFGTGVSAKVQNAYVWLMANYESALESPMRCDDEIFIFGFSRGALSARSLVGLLGISGLLQRDAPQRIVDAVHLSRVEGMSERSPIAADFRRRYSRRVSVKFLGVWDTVAALGVPRIKGLCRIPVPRLENNAAHKIARLPSIVEHARHAMALDEHRYIFDVLLWPDASSAASMEQRWFVGAHANIGGGYDNDGLFRRPLQWLQQAAQEYGLSFRQTIGSLGDSFYASSPRDPLDEVAYGGYQLSQWFRRHYRKVSLGSATVESIDYTVLERWAWLPSYRPRALTHLPLRKAAAPPGMQLSDDQIKACLGIPDARVLNRGFRTVT